MWGSNFYGIFGNGKEPNTGAYDSKNFYMVEANPVQIADQVKNYLIEEGIEHAYINLGGNILTLGGKTDGSNFRIGIQKPFAEDGTVMAVLPLSDKSIVSSGNYERYFKKDGKIYHHILDPSTGYPIENNLNQVTIISDKSVDGDALSTTCYALGLDEGLKLIRSMDNIEAVFITDDNTIHKSSDSVNLITDIDN